MTQLIRTAMILAAGLGERLKPLTDHTPKPLLSAGGHTLLDWHMMRLQALNIDRVVINISHLAEQIETHLTTKWANAPFDIIVSKEPTPLETAGGIANARRWLGDAPFLILNGDVWTNADLNLALNRRWPQHSFAHLFLVPNPCHHPKGDFFLDQDGRVSCASPGQRMTYAGLGVFSPALFDLLDANAGRLGPFLRQWAMEGRVTGSPLDGCWFDVGTPKRLRQWQRFMEEASA